MDLQQQIHARIDALWQRGTLAYAEVLREIDALPAFSPVEPKEWPDAPGLWVRKGKLHRVGGMLEIHSFATGAELSPSSNRGHWLPAQLLVPPAKAAPKMTQEKWAVASSDGRILWTFDTEESANERRDKGCLCHPHAVVRIPPLPIMETER